MRVWYVHTKAGHGTYAYNPALGGVGCWDKKVDAGNLKQRTSGSVRVLSKKEGIYREADTDILLWSLDT